MKLLVVTYLPSGKDSRTKKLVDTFLENIKRKDQLEHLDLLEDTPDFFNKKNLEAYKTRNYKGKPLSTELQKSIEKLDRMTKQFIAADVVVMAFPMYNFSLPGSIKSYFDSVMLKGETFDIGKKGFVGLMEGKKALILMSSGGMYTGKNQKYDYAAPLAKLEFEFMGFSDVQIVWAQGVDMHTSDVEKIIADAQAEVKKIIKTWEL